MKKLLSICFLSIFLLMFGMQAQAQRDCCFQLSNPVADTIHGIANLPGGNLPLSHYLQPLQFQNTDTYDLIFSDASCLGIDPVNGKVSIELELWLDGENVLDGHHNVSQYCDITLQTTYNELHWIGAPMVGSNYPYAFEYPGAVQMFTGTYNISNVHFDYFFFNFLVNSKTKVMIHWNQYFRDVMLIAHVRERVNGSNHEFYWNDQQNLNLGGHQSQPASILASDTLPKKNIITKNETVLDCEPVTVGDPAFTMDITGIYKIAYVDTSCGYRIDSIVTYDYTHFAHPTKPAVADVYGCLNSVASPITLPADPNTELAGHDIVAYWATELNPTFVEMASFTPATNILDTIACYVKRYDNTTGCESEVDTFVVYVVPLPADPAVSVHVLEYCVGNTPAQLSYPAPAGHQVLWGTSVDAITSTTAPTPTATVAGQQTYFLKLQNIVTDCISAGYDSIVVNVFANPVVNVTADKTTLCYTESAVLSATPTTLTTYQWKQGGTAITGATSASYTYTNNVTAETTFNFSVDVTEAHTSVSCTASDAINILAYPQIGTPTPVHGDTLICGPATITREVALPSTGTQVKWYAADKSTLLGTGLTYTQSYNATTTIYASAVNDFSCESPSANWLAITVTVDTIPAITLTAGNGGEVCAESDLTISSSVVSSYMPVSYLWSGTGLKDPKTNSAVTFNHNVAGVYTETLKVTDANGCYNTANINITVNALPVLVNNIDYTVKNNEFCSATKDGKITFITAYPKYSIDNGTSWSTNNVFSSLPAGTYNLKVEDSKGCKNNPANTVLIKDSLTYPALTITKTTNTHCKTPFNGALTVAVAPAQATGIYEYQYKLNGGTAQTSNAFSSLEHGSYNITVVNTVTACQTDSLGVVVPNGIENIVWNPTVTANTHCNNTYTPYDGKFVVNVTSPATGDHSYYYAITAGVETRGLQTSNTFDVLQDGTYTVRVLDTVTRCEKSDNVVVTLDTATITLNFAVVNNTHCTAPFGGKITVSVTPAVATGVHEYQYEIVSGPATRAAQTSNVFDALEHGLYRVKVTDKIKGCIAEDTIRVNYVGVLPSASISTPEFICFGDTTRISMVPAGASKFDEWTYTGPADASLINPIKNMQAFTLKNFPAGKHTFSAHFTDSITHCPNVVDTTIRVIGVNVNLITIPSDGHVCEYDSLKVYCQYYPDDASDYITDYRWYARQYSYITDDTVWISPSAGNNRVSLVVTDNHNCGNSKYIDLGVYTLPDITLTGKFDYCDGSSANIVASSSHTISVYKWNGSTGTNTYSNAVTADVNVTLTVEDNKGCEKDSTFAIRKIVIPGAPSFTTPKKFCLAADIHIDTNQVDPKVGSFVWNTTNPNEVKAAGTYTAHYVNTQNGESCVSSDASVEVIVTGLPVSTVVMKYNSEGAASNSHARCYDPSASDVISLTVTPPASGSKTITYKRNGVDATSSMNITRTAPGTYMDTIYVKVVSDNSGCTCEWDTTLYYTLTVNALPTVPDNFPYSYNGGDSTIFYCAGGAASYDFNIPSGYSATYNSSTTPPTSASDNVALKITSPEGCSSTFYYDIVEVSIPTIALTSGLADNCSDTLTGKVFATVSPDYAGKSYSFAYTWWNNTTNPYATHTSSVNKDTLDYSFIAQIDTIVYANMTINATSGPVASYSASCASNNTSFHIHFQPEPSMPALNSTAFGYVTSDSAAYCAGATFSISASDFTTSTGATVSIVGGGPITTAGVYKVVANNNDLPKCPSDTLILKVHEKRVPVVPTDLGTRGYDYKVYFCAATTPDFNFTAADAHDVFTYSNDAINYVSTKPTAAGAYILRVTDSEEGCKADFNFDIIEIANPNFNITMPATWKDSNICQTSNNYNLTFSPTISDNYTPSTGVTSTRTATWSGAETTSPYSHIYNFTVNADTSLTFAFNAYDTIGNNGYGVKCAYTGFTDAITLDYFSTPDAPVYNGLTQFCYGDSVVIGVDSFTLATTGTELYSTTTLPVTYKTTAPGGYTHTLVVQSMYTAFNACKSTPTTTVSVIGNNLPVVKIAPHDTTICKGGTATFTASGASTYVWSTSATTNSIMATDTAHYVVTGTDVNGCVNTDTVVLRYHDVYTVEVSNDTTVCVHEMANISAVVTGTTGDFTLSWYKNDSSTSFSTSTKASGVADSHIVEPDSSIIVNDLPVPTVYHLKVVDSKGCENNSQSISIVATNRPQITFRAIGGSEPIRYIETHAGDQTAFEMYIDTNCMSENMRVYVDFEIYKDGVLMTNEELANTLEDYLSGYNTSYSFDLTQNAPAIITQTMKSSNYNSSANFFPQSEFLDGTSYDYDWFFMHFINERKITVNLGQWKPNTKGVYTFRYFVVEASPYSAQNGSVYNGLKRIGGHGSHNAPFTPVVVAYDYFTICVDTTYLASATDFIFDAHAEVASSEESTVEKVDMIVYPNPAANNVNVVLEGVSGQTVITVHDMSGKAVSSMRVDVDNNGQIINLPVDNYSQGIYFIKAVNGDAVMTKKLIIAR